MQKCTKDIRECTKFNGKRNNEAEVRIRFRRNGGRRKKKKKKKKRGEEGEEESRREQENKFQPCHSRIEPEIMLGM